VSSGGLVSARGRSREGEGGQKGGTRAHWREARGARSGVLRRGRRRIRLFRRFLAGGSRGGGRSERGGWEEAQVR